MIFFRIRVEYLQLGIAIVSKFSKNNYVLEMLSLLVSNENA